MDKREAKRVAHVMVADLIDGHLSNYGEPFTSNQADDKRITDALRELAQRHRRSGEQ